MSKLLAIQNTVQQIAEAITEALGIDTEIIDNELTIVAGTGRYKKKIGMKEENGNLESGYIYGQLLKSGEDYIIEEATTDPPYGAMENEVAEICCPIISDGEVVGLIALVAFNQKQKKALLYEGKNHLLFLKKMAYLIAAKLSEEKISNQLKAILESIYDGIIAVDKEGFIVSCNRMAEKLIGKDRKKLIGKRLKEIWHESPVEEVIKKGIHCKEREEIYYNEKGEQMHFLTTIRPVYIGEGDKANNHEVIEAVISFRDIYDVKTMIYNISEKKQNFQLHEILGNTAKIQEVKEQAWLISGSNSTVLITGESGTGKELFARAIHSASPRSKEPFITVNCGAIPENLLESELFGYEEGAFTGAKKSGKVGKFELANKGTIFLDEIGDLPLHLQVKLLHVLQRREIERVGGNRVIAVDVRVIAATNRDLYQMMKDKEFREDLYFRLNVIPLHIPPLRERLQDVPLLLDYFLKKFNCLIGKNIIGFDEKTLDLLKSYRWPGNVRELENTVEYAVNIETGDYVTTKSIPTRIKNHRRNQKTNLSLKERLDAYQKSIIEMCLQEYGTSIEGKKKTAQLLQISEATLYRRIKELNISGRRYK